MIGRKAASGDFEQLVTLARMFTTESGLPLTFNEARARKTLWATIHSPALDFLVVAEAELVLGAAILVYEHEYYDETCAYVDKMFIHRQFRGLGASDTLVDLILRIARDRDASVIYASATAAMGERIEKLFVRLFERHGFTVLGRIIMRSLP